MKKIVLVFFVLTATALPAFAQTNPWQNLSPYVAARAGFGMGDSYAYLPEYSGYGGMIAAGVQYLMDKIDWRFEFEVSQFQYKNEEHEDKTGIKRYTAEYKLNNTMYLANFNFEVLKDYKIQLFGGLAMGMASFNEKATEETYVYLTDVTFKSGFENNKTALAMGLNAGFGFNVTDDLHGEIGGRCIEFSAGDKIRVCDVTLGARYHF